MPTFQGVTVLGENSLGGILNAPPTLTLLFFPPPIVIPLNLRKVGTLYFISAVGGGAAAILLRKEIYYPGEYFALSLPNTGQNQFFLLECSRPGLPYVFQY